MEAIDQLENHLDQLLDAYRQLAETLDADQAASDVKTFVHAFLGSHERLHVTGSNGLGQAKSTYTVVLDRKQLIIDTKTTYHRILIECQLDNKQVTINKDPALEDMNHRITQKLNQIADDIEAGRARFWYDEQAL